MQELEIPLGSLICKIEKKWFKKKQKIHGNEIPKEELNKYFSNPYNDFSILYEEGWQPIGIIPTEKMWLRRNKEIVKIKNHLYIIIYGPKRKDIST